MAIISKGEQQAMERLLENVGNLGTRYDVAPQQGVEMPNQQGMPSVDTNQKEKIVMNFVLSINNLKNSFSSNVVQKMDDESIMRIVKLTEDLDKISSWLRVAKNNT